ncbi:MAG TPA: hypothetical protein VF042_03280 [Gemmatimonadaceae bacterium]
MLNHSFMRRGAGIAAVAVSLITAACSSDSSGLGGNQMDKTKPTVDLVKGGTSADTVISFQVDVKDNLGIKNVKVSLTGGLTMSFDTTFTSANTDATIPFTISVPRSIPKGTPVLATSFATDGAGNKSATDSLNLTVGNVPPAEVRIGSPAAGSIAVVGKSLVMSINARSAVKVRTIGFKTAGSFEMADSSSYSSPLPDSVAILDTLTIPANAPTGPLQVTPFILDSLGQRTTGPTITLNVQPPSAINSTPVVSFTHTPRVEVNDTLHVEASDQTGIVTIGYEVRRTPGGTIDARDSLQSNGSITSQIRTFDLRLPYTTFPTVVYVQAFARNSNGVRAYAKLPGGAERVDTVTVVAGSTKSLPNGGSVADALYHPRTDRLYFTNIERNQLEVFSLSDSSFKSAILVGSRPWGIAAWPRDHNGTMGDTLLVANSGATDISYVNLNGGGSGREVYRYPLPNIIVYTVTSKKSQAGFTVTERTPYDFSDRPQYIGTTCTGTGFGCGDVVLTYSTTPTKGQSEPFATNNGTLRWENLMTHKSHFFFEQAMGQDPNSADTLEIRRFDAVTGDETILVPQIQKAVTAGGEEFNYAIVVKKGDLAFRDTTFVRNSGNFTRAAYGEGGPVNGTRAMTFDVNRGFVTQVTDLTGTKVGTLSTPVVDRGVSQAADVSDFVANSFAKVMGVAMNFDGSLAGIRADSTYLLNVQLRLQGILGTTQSNAGLDFHPMNSGPNSFPLSSRLVFAASAEPVIEIFDSYCYKRVATVPIRDPINGPIKAAFRQSSGQIVLVGATARGVVIVTLPNNFTTSCL